jgi:hypothetical protein
VLAVQLEARRSDSPDVWVLGCLGTTAWHPGGGLPGWEDRLDGRLRGGEHAGNVRRLPHCSGIPEPAPNERDQRRGDAEQRRREPGGVPEQAKARARDEVVHAQRHRKAKQGASAADLERLPPPHQHPSSQHPSEMDANVKGRLRFLLVVGQGGGCWGLATGAMATTTVTLRCAGRDRRTVSGRELPRTRRALKKWVL